MSINYIKDYYQILEISTTASKSEIREAYKKESLRFHPDKNREDGAELKFIDIREAYEVLKDEELRKDYDENRQDPSYALFHEFVTKKISFQQVEEFLKAGASIDAHNAHNQTILMYAANRGDIPMVEFLIQMNASVVAFDSEGNTPLMYSAMKETIEFSVDNISILKQRHEKFKAAEFDDEILKSKNEEVEKELDEFFKNAEEIKHKTNKQHITQEDISNKPINKDKAVIAQILINNGAHLEDVNNHNKTAIDFAVDYSNKPLMNLLYKLLEMEDKITPESEGSAPCEVEISSNLVISDSITDISKTGSKLKLVSISLNNNIPTISENILRYGDEGISWIEKEFSNQRVVVPNKVDTSIISHVINNYQGIDSKLFLQGDPYDHDLARYLALKKHGGMYRDLDYSFEDDHKSKKNLEDKIKISRTADAFRKHFSGQITKNPQKIVKISDAVNKYMGSRGEGDDLQELYDVLRMYGSAEEFNNEFGGVSELIKD